ncbi:SMP-30/gluconolactonase/LRE family protein [Enhygromyxa salina]|uniref:SMP-30/gluconolactonase/LRE family protein n=1 Tax=Enhygromyxa salina TaxID=215803 RepID=UPI0015E5B9E2|nr:hypothetical protein [Enhygromyxa salina]
MGSAPALAAEVEVIESYDASVGEYPEGVAVSPDGDIYVTLAGTGELRRIDGKTHVGQSFAQLDPGGGFLLGMAFDDDELYVALGSFDDETSGIWHVDDEGDATRVVAFTADQFPNDLAFDDEGNMYVTESISGAVYKVEEGSNVAELWVQDPLLFGDVDMSPVPFPIGVNGIAYDEHTDSVLVVNSQVPALIEIEDDDGEAGALSVLAAGEHLRGADGIALEKDGDVILVSNYHSELMRIDRDSGCATVLADGSDGLFFPSTVAFGQRRCDRRSLYVVNFGFGGGPDAPVGLLRIKVGG